MRGRAYEGQDYEGQGLGGDALLVGKPKVSNPFLKRQARQPKVSNPALKRTAGEPKASKLVLKKQKTRKFTVFRPFGPRGLTQNT